MKTRKSLYQRILAWMLVVTLVLSTGINAWADEPVTEAETVAETQMATEEESETQAQTADAVEPFEIEETQEETISEVETEPVTTELETAEEEKVPGKAVRATPEEVTSKFENTVSNVKMGDKQIGMDSEYTLNSYWELSFDMSWNQKEGASYTGNPGDWIEFTVFKIKAKDKNGTSIKPLFDRLPVTQTLEGEVVVNGVQTTMALGTGTLNYRIDEETNEATIFYKVTFGENIESKTSIAGTVEGKFILKCDTLGHTYDVSANGEQIGKITIVQKSGIIPGWGYPDVRKENSSGGQIVDKEGNVTGYSLTWLMNVSDIAKKGFENYETNKTAKPGAQEKELHSVAADTYKPFIITDTLDKYQYFSPGSDANDKGGFNLYSFMFKTHVYVPIPNEDNSNEMGQNTILITEVRLRDLVRDNKIQYIDPTKPEYSSAQDAVDAVKGQPKSFTIVEIGEGAEKQQRFVLNMGTPGIDGFKISEFLPSATVAQFKTTIEKDLALYQYQIDRAMAEAEKMNEADLADDYSWTCEALPSDHPSYPGYEGFDKDADLTVVGATTSVKRLKEIRDGYRFAKEYYASDEAWLYALQMYVTVGVDFTAASTGVTPFVNNWEYDGTVVQVNQDVEAKNRWVATISAKAANGDAQIFKADSLYTADGEGIELGKVLSLGDAAMKGVQFNVFKASDTNFTSPIKFTLSASGDSNGKYVKDDNGEAVVETNGEGSIILKGLEAGVNYVIKETQGLAGYYTEGKEITFTVDSSKPMYYLMKNTARGVKVVKTDAKDGSPLSGVEFELYQYDGTETDAGNQMEGFAVKSIGGNDYIVYTGDTNDQEELKTDASGELQIMQLPAGNYYFKEVAAPEGYDLPTDNRFEFVLTDKMETVAVVSVDIENRKTATPVSVNFQATKSLTGRTLKADEFSFTAELKSGTAENVTGLTDGKIIAKNAAGGAVQFGNLTYKAAGSYIYAVSEDAGTVGGVVYDTTTYYVEVKVTDDGTGELSAAVKYYKTYSEGTLSEELTNGIAFTNTYSAEEVSANFQATKSLTGRTLKADEFSFTAELKSGTAGNVTGLTDGKITAKNAAGGAVQFGNLTYKAAGSYIYAVSEDAGTVGGVAYDTTTYYVEVKVTDDGTGELSAEVKYYKAYSEETLSEELTNGIEFKNSYSAKSVSADLGVSKTLEGATLKDGQFEFTAELIKGTTGNVEGLTAGKITANNVDGNITFSQKYKAAGTYIYEISETNGGTIKDEINYDGSKYYAEVVISDNQSGQLVADSVKYYKTYDAANGLTDEISGARPEFKNKALALDTVALDTKVIDAATGEEVDGTRTAGEIQKGSPSENEVIEDTVTYSGLKPNTKYVIDGKLWHYTNPADTETGEVYCEYQEDGSGAIVKGYLTDDAGNSTYVFETDETGVGKIEVIYSFNGKNLGLTPIHGSYLVAYETIYEYDDSQADHQGAVAIAHTDSKDKDQTIHYIHGSGSHLYSTSYTVMKEWDDKDNAAGDRPSSIKVQLYRDGEKFVGTEAVAGEQTLEESNNWTYTWTDLPQFQDGTHVDSVYTVEEVEVPENYIESVNEDGVITNTHKAKDTKAEILKVDEAGKALAGAELELYDAKGKLMAAWTSTGSAYELSDKLIPGETYTLREKKAPAGYMLAKEVSFKAEAVGTVTKVKMTDIKVDEKYSVSVTKYVSLDGVYRSTNYSFYTALFWDEACTQRATEVKELKLADSYTTTVKFDQLAAGTYYVAETDINGVKIDETDADVFFTPIISGGKITLTSAAPSASATITNDTTGKTPPGGFLQEDDGVITINKSVVAGDVETAVSDTFYFTLYSDEEMTQAISTMYMTFKNHSKGSGDFTKLAYGTYYIAESDENGVPVGEEFAYEVSVDVDQATLTSANKTVTVNIVNDSGEEETETETETSTETEKETKKTTKPTYKKTTITKTGTSVKTGDTTQVMLYAAIMLIALLAIGGVAWKRRKAQK